MRRGVVVSPWRGRLESVSQWVSWWRQLLSLARECCLLAFNAVVELDWSCVFEVDELAERCLIFRSGGRILMFIP